MEEKNQIEFLIDKLLGVSEKTIENLVKLKEELSTSKEDHAMHKQILEMLLERQREIDNTLKNFKDRKPFEFFEEMERNQESICNVLTDLKERLFNNSIETNITEIKTNVDHLRTREDMMRKVVLIFTAIPSVLLIILMIYKFAFENNKIKDKQYIEKIVKELIIKQ